MPKSKTNFRVQTTWYKRPQAPEIKKKAKTTKKIRLLFSEVSLGRDAGEFMCGIMSSILVYYGSVILPCPCISNQFEGFALFLGWGRLGKSEKRVMSFDSVLVSYG